MKSTSKLKTTIPYLIIAILIVAIAIIQLKNNKQKTADRVYKYDNTKPIKVITEVAKLQDIHIESEFTGTFEPNQETKISADIQGKITSVLVDLGDFVKQNQAIIQLDNSLLKLQLKSVNIQIEGLEVDVNRYTKLKEVDAIQGIQLEKAILGLKTAKAQRETIEEQINKTTIRAPFDGYVTSKLTEAGAFAAPGVPLLQVTDISKLKFTINVTENDLKYFNMNDNYPILSNLYKSDTLFGKVLMIGSKSNLSNAFPIQMEVKNLQHNSIKAGMFGSTKLNINLKEKGFLIPSSAIVGTSLKPQLYIIRNNEAKLVYVNIIERTKNYVVITNGINENDLYVSTGQINLFDGAKITTK